MSYKELARKLYIDLCEVGSSKSWWNLRKDLKAKKINGKWILTYSKASSY